MKCVNVLKTIFLLVLNFVLVNCQEVYSVLEFCHDKKLFSFSTKVCPGGVRFVQEPMKPAEDCVCTAGSFITVGAQFGVDYRIITGKEQCLTFSGTNVIQNSNSSYDCDNEAEHTRWEIIPLTDYGSVTEDWVAIWSDPSKVGEFQDFTRFPLRSYRNDLVFGKKDTFTGYVAIIKSKNSTLSQLQIGETCFNTFAEQGGQVLIYNDKVLTKSASSTAGKTCTVGEDKKVDPDQIVDTSTNSEFFCDINPECVEHESTYAVFSQAGPPRTEWATLSADERKDELHNENVHLVEYRMRMEHQGATVVVPYESHRLEIVNMSRRILQKGAADVISASLIETAFKLFYYLYFDVDTETELKDTEYAQIVYALEQCLYNIKPMTFGKSGCPVTLDSYSATMLKGVPVSYDKSEMPADRKFDPLKNDAIVEMMWKAVDFTHAQCFRDFEYHSNLHHYFENQMEKLFLMDAVQYRWNRDIPAGMKLYGPILPKLDSRTMENLDFVVGSAHLNNVYDNWLKKPVLDVGNAEARAKTEPNKSNFNGFKIWGGLAICLQYKEFNAERVQSENAGIHPRLSEISKALKNGPVKCPKENKPVP